MKVLLIHRYFWPDTPPYASMLLAIAKQLVADGYEVEVFTSAPSYKSNASALSNSSNKPTEGISIKRISLFKENGRSVVFRLMNMIYFPLRILLHILVNPKINIVMSSTAPPVITGFSSALGAKLIRAKFVYHCMDIHPEIGAISGEFKNPLLFKILLTLDQWSCKTATHIIVLSRDMKNSLLNRDENTKNSVKIINNFSLSDQQKSEKIVINKEYCKTQGTFRILFAGNIGRFQMLESFIDAMELLADLPQIELVFLGEGAALNSLKDRVNNKLANRIKFFPHQDISTARAIMSEADLGIVSLLPNVYHYALPSKTMTYLAEGCPILATVEPNSELVKFIKDNDIGLSALPGDTESIAKAIRSFINNTKLRNNISENCIDIANEQFSETSIMKQWSKLYKNLSGSPYV